MRPCVINVHSIFAVCENIKTEKNSNDRSDTMLWLHFLGCLPVCLLLCFDYSASLCLVASLEIFAGNYAPYALAFTQFRYNLCLILIVLSLLVRFSFLFSILVFLFRLLYCLILAENNFGRPLAHKLNPIVEFCIWCIHIYNIQAYTYNKPVSFWTQFGDFFFFSAKRFKVQNSMLKCQRFVSVL